MANLNKVMLIGRLTDDPKVTPFSNGGKVAKFRFAVNNRKKDQATGQWVDDPVYIDVEAFNRGEFGKQADLVEQYLAKGRQIFIEGHLKLDQWEKDGQKRSRLLVVVDNIQFLDSKQDSAPGAPRPAARPAAGPRQPEPTGGGYDEPAEVDAPPTRGGTEEEIPF